MNRRVEGHNFQTPLFDAAYNKQLDMLRVLLKHKADPSAADKLQRTPLHVAAVTNGVPVLQLLLEAKADASKRDNYDRTPLEVAVDKESRHAVEFLTTWERKQKEEERARLEAEATAAEAVAPDASLQTKCVGGARGGVSGWVGSDGQWVCALLRLSARG